METAKTNVKDRIVGIVTTAWKFWPLVHCLTYTVVPAQHRILWVNCVDLFWNAILASMTGAKTNHEESELNENIRHSQEDLSSPIILKQDIMPVSSEKSLLFGNSTAMTQPTAVSNATVEFDND